MGKRMVVAVAVIFAAALFLGAAQDAYAQAYKMGYVNGARVMYEYKKVKDFEKVWDEKAKVKEAEAKKITDELRKLKDEQALLSDKAKAEKQTVIDAKIRDLQEFRKKSQEEFMKERDSLLGEVNQGLEKTVAAYAKEAGYDIVLDSRVIIYGSEKDDLTNEAMARMNKPKEVQETPAKK